MLIREPNIIYELLDKYVIGQKESKKTLSVAYFLHCMRCVKHINSGAQLKKSPILLYGPTGCGKTYLLDILCKKIKLPYMRVSAKDITVPGYKGQSMDEMIKSYVSQYQDDKELAPFIPYGLIHIDEFDKICYTKDGGTSVDSWIIHQQQQWLNFLEGHTYSLTTSPQSGTVKKQYQNFDTHNLMVVLSGSFTQVELFFEDKNSVNPIGFTKNMDDKPDEQLTRERFIECGMIRELAGRLSMITKLEKLGKDDLFEIIKAPGGVYQQYVDMFSSSGMVFSSESLDLIVDQALEMNTGARGLQAAIEDLLVDQLFELDYTFQPELTEKIV